jgi:hypothetical protein
MKKSIRVRHYPEIPKTELKNCLKYYIKFSQREGKIVYVNNFFGCTWFKIDPSMSLSQAYCKYQDRLEGIEDDE